MAVKISSFATQPGPLTGTELVTGLVSGVNKNMLTQDIANLAGLNEPSNGVAASISNTTGTVHSYTIAANKIAVGSYFQYETEFQAVNMNVSPLTGDYVMEFMIGATPFNFGTETVQVSPSSGDNSIGYMDARFSVTNDSGTDFLICRYNITLYNPSNPNISTYSNFNFLFLPITIGADSFEVGSRLTTSSPDLTFTILYSNLIEKL